MRVAHSRRRAVSKRTFRGQASGAQGTSRSARPVRHQRCRPVQSGGGDVIVIRPGEVIWIPPGEERWDGGAPDHFTTHGALREATRPTGRSHDRPRGRVPRSSPRTRNVSAPASTGTTCQPCWGRVREDTWGRLGHPARPALTPSPTLRTSHFPDPPAPTLRPRPMHLATVLRLVPAALSARRPAGTVKRSLLDGAEERRIIDKTGTQHPLDTEGSHESAPADARAARRMSWVHRSMVLRRTRTFATGRTLCVRLT